jgi:hypothetical protein
MSTHYSKILEFFARVSQYFFAVTVSKRWKDDKLKNILTVLNIFTYLVTVDRIWIGNWIYSAITQLVTAINYIAIANSYTLQFTIASAKSSKTSLGVATQRFMTMGLLRLRQGASVLHQLQTRTCWRVRIRVQPVRFCAKSLWRSGPENFCTWMLAIIVLM